MIADDAAEAYQKGIEAFEQEKYVRASEYFRAVLDFGRSGEFADEAQLMLSKAYFESRQYLLAATEFGRFADLYPTDERTEEAEYGRIRSYYEVSPSYNLDQTDTDRAIAYIRLFMNRYPQSAYTDDVVTMLGALREKLARKQYEAGRLYERREQYEAAVLSYEAVLEQFTTSPFADDALLGKLRAQVTYAEASIRARQAERFQESLDTYNRLVELFPSSPLLREAEGLYDRAFNGLRAVQATAEANR